MTSPPAPVSRRAVCVYCASSRTAHADYRLAARRLGEVLAGAGITIVYGGGAAGSMGGHPGLSDLQLVEDLRTRKHLMLTMSQAAIALPGGSGTLEELLEAITLKRLGLYLNPIVLINTRGFFDPLLEVLRRAVAEHFMDTRHLSMWQVVATPDEIPQALASAPGWSAEARSFAAL
jgi:predicted Rossmann-fold nucleotide-binding protein